MMPRPTKQPTPTTPSPQISAPAAFLESDQRVREGRPLGHHPRFLLAAAPDQWEVSSGRVVPVLCRYPVRTGLNGTDAVRDHSGREVGIDPSMLRANLSSWGKVEIPHAVDGPGTSYMVQPYPGCFVDRWTTVYAHTDRVTVDQAGYDEWRLSLVRRGLIASARRPALEGLRSRLEAERDSLSSKLAGIDPRYGHTSRTELDRIEEAIRIVSAELDETPDLGRPLDATGTEATL